jgi:small subunit ribosomal protein S6
MQHYEALAIISSKITEEELPFIIDKVFGIIRKAGGEITRDETIGKKKLAYPIKQNRYGFYVLLEFDLETAKLKEIEKELGLTEEIIRYQVVKAVIKTEEEKEQEKARIIAATKEEEEEKKPVAKVPAPTRTTIPEVKVERKEPKEEKEKVSLEELDEKLDKILDDDIIK